MSREEKDYLEACFRLPVTAHETSEGGYEHFSYYTFSHRVKNGRVNSSRLAYGSVANPEGAWQAAIPVLEKRDISLPRSLTESNKFYGLGWDIEESQFKVYFRTLDWTKLDADFFDLVENYDPETHRGEALLSLTFENRDVSERKIYLYPKDEYIPTGALGYARMVTDKRGEVAQTDIDPQRTDLYELGDIGKQILEKYEEVGEDLDTVAYKSEDDFTLYFP